jgi:hypothetical protein
MNVKVKYHPILEVPVRSNGMVFVPGTPGHAKDHWTFGCRYSDGYYRVAIHKKRYLVHRLIAETFISNPNNKPCVDHILHDRADNNVCQLRWATPTENQLNRIDNIPVAHLKHNNPKVYHHYRNHLLDNNNMTASQRHRAKMYALGFKCAKMPDGSRKWILKENKECLTKQDI